MDERSELLKDHSREAIARRIKYKQHRSYSGDAILGAIDGTVTTFAIIAAGAGAHFPGTAVAVLGLANLFADGFSMAVSNYQGTKARNDELEQARRSELRHIELIPEGEREEVRQIFNKKGMQGPQLDTVVNTITRDKNVWLETMLSEELGLETAILEPRRAGLVTFAAFLGAGLVPLVPFFLPAFTYGVRVQASMFLAASSFFLTGALEGRMAAKPAFVSGLRTLGTGSAAAGLAFLIGSGLSKLGHIVM